MSTSRRRLSCLILFLLPIGCARDSLSDLISRLTAPDVAVRRAATRELIEKPNADTRIIAALTKNAAHKDLEVRYLSVEALGKLGPDGRSSIPFLKLALADSEKRVSLEAGLAIAKIDPQEPACRPVITSAIREGDGRTLLAIGAMGADAAWAVPALNGLLSHEKPQVRALAARTLGRIGPAAIAAKPALESTARDSNAAVQKASKDALSHLQNTAAVAK